MSDTPIDATGRRVLLDSTYNRKDFTKKVRTALNADNVVAELFRRIAWFKVEYVLRICTSHPLEICLLQLILKFKMNAVGMVVSDKGLYEIKSSRATAALIM